MKKQSDNTGKKMIIYGLVVLLFLGGMYFLTSVLVKKNKYIEKTTIDNGSVSIQYSEIILGEVFSKNEDEYLVLCYDKKDKTTNLSTTVSTLMSADKIKVYTVDLSHAFNKGLLSNEGNPNATKSSELKINGSTLIHIHNQKIEDYIEGEDAIQSFVEDYQ